MPVNSMLATIALFYHTKTMPANQDETFVDDFQKLKKHHWIVILQTHGRSKHNR